MLTYDYGQSSGVNGRVWGSFVYQRAEDSTGRSATVNGYELGGNLKAGAFETALSGFTSKAIGDSVMFLNSTDLAGNRYRTYGFMGKLTYDVFPARKWACNTARTATGTSRERRTRHGLLGCIRT